MSMMSKVQRLWWMAATLLALPVAAGGQGQAPSSGTGQGTGRVIEDVVARVNNEIITLSDLARARTSILGEIEQECSQAGCTTEKREQLVKDGETHLLRDLIDQSLMVQRAKEIGISVETDLVKYMDRVRRENNLPDMEALEKAVESQGLVFEDWKDSVRKQMLQQELVRREVRPDIPDSEIKDYYEKHKDEFVRDERAFLSEIFCTTEGKPESEWPAVEERCKKLRSRVVDGGEEFAAIAKAFSDGSTAAQGGDLGGEGFEPGGLPKELSEPVFKLKRGEVTEVIRVQSGFIVLRVNHRYEKGLQPVENVTGEIQNKLYGEKMRPELRKYLTDLRTNSYVLLKPGYLDSAGVESTPIVEIAAAQPKEETEQKKKRHWYWPF